MKEVVLSSEREKAYAENLVKQSPPDGSITVVIKKTDISSTAKQRKLAWLWNSEVAASGLGRDDLKEGVHTTCKWMFARPILLRDDEVFGAVYAGFSKMVEQIEEGTRSDFWREFTRDFISTERMTMKQRSEYLKSFQYFWTSKGVSLTDPSLQGVDLSSWQPVK